MTRTVTVRSHDRTLPARPRLIDNPTHRALRTEVILHELERDIGNAVIANLKAEYGRDWERVEEAW